MTREEFDDLIEKYLSGQASPEEEKRIDDFFQVQERKQTLEHYKLSDEMWSAIHRKVRESKPVFSTDTEMVESRSFLRRMLIPISVAASLLLIGLVGYRLFFGSDQSSVPMLEARTEKGQKAIITLSDHSVVYLNSESTIRYPETFEEGKREVILTGEAFFEVAPDKTKPFLVHTGAVTTQVLGTSFNINTFSPSDIRVTVASGKVKVSTETGSGTDTASNAVILLPNQQAIYNAHRRELKTAEVDIDRFIAWKNNSLYFDDTSLDEAAVQLGRWYDVTIVFENDRIRNCRINGKFKDATLSTVLESIRYMYPVEYKFISHNKVLLYGEGCD